MRIQLRVVENEATLQKRAVEALRTRLNVAFGQAAGGIRRRVGSLCDALIADTEAYRSLLGGQLLGELGIPEVRSRLDAILAAVRDGIQVEAVPFRAGPGRLSGGLKIGILRSRFGDLLSLPDASYVSAPSGETIRWLDWLLMQGDRIIVAGYDSFFDLDGGQKARSRTGLALMRRGQGWHVPFEFSGTADGNFLTRAFDAPAVEAALAKIIREEIEARL